MVENITHPAEDRQVAAYDLQATFRTYNKASNALIAQAMVRQVIALRLSIDILTMHQVFERYGIPDPNSETSQAQLRGILLDEAQRLLEMAVALAGPDVSLEQQANALASMTDRYIDLYDLRPDEQIIARERAWITAGQGAQAQGPAGEVAQIALPMSG